MSHLKLGKRGSSLCATGLVAEFQLSGNDVSIQEQQRFHQLDYMQAVLQ
jgi:hypothetical protein